MRPIEFRAWYIDEKVMAYSDNDAEFDVAYWDGANCSRIEMINYLCRPLNMILMQYTGLQDAEGNKIFEGDIVRGAWSENLKPMVVEYQAPSFIMRISKKQWSEFIIHHEDNQLYIVIGNKYQHGELLNEQKTANIGTDRDG